MASWGATQAKAKFSEVLDKAETEGPQIVRRRKQVFFVLTREQHESVMQQPAKTKEAKGKTLLAPGRRTMSTFFRNSPLAGLDIEFERVPLTPRHIEL